MTHSAVDAGATPAPQPLPARFLGVIVAPAETFKGVVARPRWFGMLALTTIIIAVMTALPMTTEDGRLATVDAQVSQMEAWGMTVTDQQYASLEQGSRYAAYTTGASILFVSPIMALIIAGILFVVFNAIMGGDASFKQLFAVLVHAGAISALSALFTGPLNYFRGSVTSATNLGVLLPMLDERSFLGRLFGGIDLFLIWYVIVLAIGLAVLYRKRTTPIAVGLLTVYGVLLLGYAGITTFLGSR